MMDDALRAAGGCGGGHEWREGELLALRRPPENGGDGVRGRPLFCQRCGARMGELERLFNELDRDGSGKLEHSELLSLSHRLFSSEEDRSAAADPADIDGERAALEEALVRSGCVARSSTPPRRWAASPR